jgi:hypothetical protein
VKFQKAAYRKQFFFVLFSYIQLFFSASSAKRFSGHSFIYFLNQKFFMQKSIFLFAFAVIAMACNNNETAKTAESTEAAAKPAVTLPYMPSYSSSFEIGNPAYAATILQGSWKDWEENKMDNMKSWVADTVLVFQSDNVVIKGADSLLANWKKGRALYSSVIDTIDAVIPVYSTDKKENWVLVWATEIHTKASDGSKETVAVMETWRINKDGKADLVLQFDRAKRKQ